MSLIATGHEKPVNMVAARLLMRAPWWAQYPEPAKKCVVMLNVEHSWDAWINYTKGPPASRADEMPIADKRGRVIECKDGKLLTVIGYGNDGSRQAKVKNGHTPPAWWRGGGWDGARVRQTTRREHFWWVVKNGEMYLENLSSGRPR